MNNNNRGNNNNGNNNRRRGRGNNRPQGGGGGQQTNRVDSRARGNAPQMLEKYRKLAHDAHLNGDRVQAEYYLQFADHYFRVIADTRLRQEEQRARRDERWDGNESPQGDADGDDFSVESDFPTFDQPPVYARRDREADDRPRGERPERAERGERPERAERPERGERAERQERPARQPRREEAPAEPEAVAEPGEAQANPYEPAENPFIRPSRNTRGLRPRRDDRQPRAEEPEALGLDPSSLPPAITRDEAPVAEEAPAAEAKPRRRAPRRKVAEEGGDAEATASVG